MPTHKYTHVHTVSQKHTHIHTHTHVISAKQLKLIVLFIGEFSTFSDFKLYYAFHSYLWHIYKVFTNIF